MTTYNTGNPVPSADARDRFDNSQVFDEYLNSLLATTLDRMGRARMTVEGQRLAFEAAQASRAQAFKDFLDASGYSSLGPYAAGIEIISHSQYVEYMGQPYALKATVPASLDNPYVVTGNWATESANFKLIADSTLRQDLLSPTGFALIPSLTASLDTFADIEAYSGTAKQFHVSGAYARFDGGSGLFTRLTSTTKVSDRGVYLADALGRIWVREFTGVPYAAWYGVVGDNLSVNYSARCQAAITEGCTYHGGVAWPHGQIQAENLVFPNKGFTVSGISGTRVEFVSELNNAKIFDFSSCNGPAKVVREIGFSKLNGGSYAGITAIYTNNTNGLLLDACWSRGLYRGLRYHGSFINQRNTVFEYNYHALWCDTPCTESCWSDITFYKNEQVDARLTGDQSTFTWFGANGISTRIEGLRLDDCTNATIYGIVYDNTDNSSGFTPVICHATGISNNNYVDIKTKGLGMTGLFLEGANVTDNEFVVNFKNTAATGNKAIRSSSSQRNIIRGSVSGWEVGVEAIGCTDSFDLKVSSCSVGQVMNACNFSKWRIINRGNTIDVQPTSVTIIDLYHYEGNRSALNAIPYLVTRRGFTKHVLVNGAPPNSLDSWEQGDTAENRLPSPGNPATWACTQAPAVGGSGGTWKVTSSAAA